MLTCTNTEDSELCWTFADLPFALENRLLRVGFVLRVIAMAPPGKNSLALEGEQKRPPPNAPLSYPHRPRGGGKNFYSLLTTKRIQVRKNELVPEITFFYLKDLSARQGKLLITILRLFLLFCESPSSPLKPQAPIPFLSSGWHVSLSCPACFSVPNLWGSCIYKTKFIFPVTLSYVDFIIRPAEEPRRKEGKKFLPCTLISK